MPLPNKPHLLSILEDAVRESQWSLLHLSPRGEHPARYQLYRDRESFTVRVYIWNLTPGGQNRPDDEWRIQATGVSRFEQEPKGKTLILGWQDEWEVFAGFDFAHHQGALGHSPSIQLRQAALDRAAVHDFAVHSKGSGELAIAFRPDFLGAYATNLESLHACGQAPQEANSLDAIGRSPESVEDEDMVQQFAEPRHRAVLSVRRSLRESGFRRRVLTAYGQRCAMCGIQLRLLDGAHILPAAHPDSTDETCNGIALCALHHRAFDRAFVAFDPKFRVHVSESMATKLEEDDKAGGLANFRSALRPVLGLPPDRKDRPAPHFVEAANQLRGWQP